MIIERKKLKTTIEVRGYKEQEALVVTTSAHVAEVEDLLGDACYLSLTTVVNPCLPVPVVPGRPRPVLDQVAQLAQSVRAVEQYNERCISRTIDYIEAYVGPMTAEALRDYMASADQDKNSGEPK